MIMQARHHLFGSGCIPHRISMTKRWGPVGIMRVGGMGLRGLGAAAPSPVGFADFNSFESAVIASQPTCPPPYDPSCETPRDAAISSALAQWTLDPQSCHNVVCDANGNPVITPPPSGYGSGFNTTSGFIPVSSTTARTGSRPVRFKPFQGIEPPPSAPPQSTVVNPSPSTQLTTTGSSTAAPGSVTSQANGSVLIPGDTASTVGGTVSTQGNVTSVSGGDLISGVPNWVLFAGGAIVVFLLAKVK